MWNFGSKYAAKPIICDGRGFREVVFYEMIQEAVQSEKNYKYSMPSSTKYNDASRFSHGFEKVGELLRELKPFIPEYFGVVNHNGFYLQEFTSSSKLVLSDVTAAYKHKCILDLKVGTQTYEPDASIEKRRSQENKYREQKKFGFRIIGMRVYDPIHENSDLHGYLKFDKKFGRQLKEKKDVLIVLSNFFNTKIGPQRKKMVINLLKQTKELRRVLTVHNNALAFYSSSVLIAFEGDDRLASPDLFSLKIIDFAHVRYQSGGDIGFNYGLGEIIALLEVIVSK